MPYVLVEIDCFHSPKKGKRYGKMYSTCLWTSHSERSSRLSCVWWPLSEQLWFILILLRAFLLHALLPIRGQFRQPEQRGWWQKPEGTLVTPWLTYSVYPC